MTLTPSVHYVKNGEFTLAYQITGTGPKDVVYLPNESPNVVGNWIVPEHARFIERLASFARVVLTVRRRRSSPGRRETVRRVHQLGDPQTVGDDVDGLRAAAGRACRALRDRVRPARILGRARSGPRNAGGVRRGRPVVLRGGPRSLTLVPVPRGRRPACRRAGPGWLHAARDAPAAVPGRRRVDRGVGDRVGGDSPGRRHLGAALRRPPRVRLERLLRSEGGVGAIALLNGRETRQSSPWT
jgi:hypothetical protein